MINFKNQDNISQKRHLFDKVFWEKYSVSDDDEEDNEYNEDDGFSMIKLAQTPLGTMHLDCGNPIQNMNFWICHTNFKLIEKDLYDIAKIDGVEILAPMTQYQFMIGIALLFNEDIVKNKIENYLLLFDKKLKQEIINLRAKLSEYDYWAIYILPDGNLQSVRALDKSSYNKKLKQFKASSNSTKGIIYTYEDGNLNE